MNLGVERFLMLGCLAVLILELPQLLEDWRLGDGYPGEVPQPVVVVEATPEQLQQSELQLAEADEQLAKLNGMDPVGQIELPATPGL